MAIATDGRASPGFDRHLLVTGRLRDRRLALGLTQKQVVTRLASLGVSCTNKSLSSLEHGTGVDVGKLPELAAALDCTVTYLLGLTDDPRSWQPDTVLSWRRRPDRGARSTRGPANGEPTDSNDRRGWIPGPYDPERGRRLSPPSRPEGSRVGAPLT